VLVVVDDVEDAPEEEVFVADFVDFAVVRVDAKVALELDVVDEETAEVVIFAYALVEMGTTVEDDDVVEVYEGPVDSLTVVVEPLVVEAAVPPEMWNG